MEPKAVRRMLEDRQKKRIGSIVKFTHNSPLESFLPFEGKILRIAEQLENYNKYYKPEFDFQIETE